MGHEWTRGHDFVIVFREVVEKDGADIVASLHPMLLTRPPNCV
jgi:hypothetical protein